MQIEDKEYGLKKPKLKEWLHREDIRNKIRKASEEGNKDEFLFQYYSLISDAFNISVDVLEELDWIDLAVAYVELNNLQVLSYDFPMLLVEVSKKDQEEWNYDGRSWFIWLNLLAKNYGWSVEYIEELDVDTAVALLHEINSDRFAEKEWEWGLSEFSYRYDSNTKTGRFIELPKPKWMTISTKPIEVPKTKIRKDFMPVGVVRHWEDNVKDE